MKAFAWVLFLSLWTATGCARQRSSSATTDAGREIDQGLMAYLSAARSLHHEANIQEDADHADAAAQALERVLNLPHPHPGERVPEIDEVVADTCARIAELQVRRGDVQAARRAVDRGLRHAEPKGYFRGHLLEVQGLVEEAHAVRLQDAGSLDEAAAARRRALSSFDEAVRMQESVIQGALSEGGAR